MDGWRIDENQNFIRCAARVCGLEPIQPNERRSQRSWKKLPAQTSTAQDLIVIDGGPASAWPMTQARGYPSSVIAREISDARPGSQAISRPPDVCGSVRS